MSDWGVRRHCSEDDESLPKIRPRQKVHFSQASGAGRSVITGPNRQFTRRYFVEFHLSENLGDFAKVG